MCRSFDVSSTDEEDESPEQKSKLTASSFLNIFSTEFRSAIDGCSLGVCTQVIVLLLSFLSVPNTEETTSHTVRFTFCIERVTFLSHIRAISQGLSPGLA